MDNKRGIILGIVDWPEIDRQLWEQATARGGLFDGAGAAAHWRPATRRQVEKDYGLWLLHLQDRGNLDAEASPSTRVTEQRLRSFIDAMEHRGWASTTITSRVRNLREMVRVMEPDADRGLLTAVLRALSRRQIPVRNKAARVVHPSRLFEAGLAFLERLPDLQCRNDLVRSTWYRDGLITLMLTVAPLRLRNLTNLDTNQHMDRTDGCWRLRFSPEETKEHRRFEITLPRVLTPYVDGYQAIHRPRLLRGRHSTRLWISVRGAPMAAQTIYCSVCKLTERLIGHRVNPHLFRDILATAMATDAPEHVRASARLLGHASLGTTEASYNQARQLQAVRRYHEALLDRRGPVGMSLAVAERRQEEP